MDKEFLYKIPKHRKQNKNKQMGFHQNFCTAKETIIRMKRQATEWELSTRQGFYKDLQKLNSK
jgi:hypothetical protein